MRLTTSSNRRPNNVAIDNAGKHDDLHTERLAPTLSDVTATVIVRTSPERLEAGGCAPSQEHDGIKRARNQDLAVHPGQATRNHHESVSPLPTRRQDSMIRRTMRRSWCGLLRGSSHPQMGVVGYSTKVGRNTINQDHIVLTEQQ